MTPRIIQNGQALCPRCSNLRFLATAEGDVVACAGCGFVCTVAQAVLAWEAEQVKEEVKVKRNSQGGGLPLQPIEQMHARNRPAGIESAKRKKNANSER